MLFAPSGPQSPRRRNRLKAIFITIAIVLAIYLVFFAGDEARAKTASSDDKPSYAQRHGATPKPKNSDKLARPITRKHKELVVARMKTDDTSWLSEYFPDWPQSIYVVDDKRAPLTVARNKGRESMVYLT